MCEQCRTKVRARFFSLTAYAIQHCPMCNNKSILPELPIFPIIVSLYDYSLWDTYIGNIDNSDRIDLLQHIGQC